ncbi:hypothetical protein SYNPS1DRAFT_18983 [Syncephalis pseudoplumigaleata]|uniref:DUF1749 domain-containing protein n=1 Tax=Syncephalis pseudoplumigaleata TaxID=1712513 RepID=A0A4P9YTG4_9FUNG|nr:hypothetical protein SYNPS1DRAFT_18983 [Syncephalis pseudoplumigaleata]|eukprot:RKP23207.1 hypothetical protein SYNPS1DRAFT_18983 [Syncephalis pseudoplumigaleata]
MPLQQLQGALFQYHPHKPHLVAFRSPCAPAGEQAIAAGCVVLVAGLTEGPLALPFTTALADTLAGMHCELVQPVLSSSYLGYGTGLLTRDIEELDCLLEQLYETHGQRNIILMGHSTGSQIVLAYARTGKYRTRILGGILQGAASDREYYATQLADLPASLAMANEMRAAHRGHHWMPVDAYPDAPITADRFWSLVARG